MSSRKNTKRGRSSAAVETPPVGKGEAESPPKKTTPTRRKRTKTSAPPPAARIADAPAPPPEPQVIAEHYEIQEKAASGGMCELYLATHKKLGGKWAVKILSPTLAQDQGIVERFLDEARIEAVLQHRNIVKVVAVGQEQGLHYMVMHYVDGEDLATRMDREGTLSEREAVSIAIETAQALDCAHQSGIVHRDLKPSNIRIDLWGTVIVLDFGIARAIDAADRTRTKVGVRLGTPLYMSPEQIQGGSADARSDLYALGVILYELVSGRNPFDAESQRAVYSRQLYTVPPSLKTAAPQCSDRFSTLVGRLLNKDPAQRYQTAGELIADLRLLSRKTDIKTPRPGSGEPTPEPVEGETVREVPETVLADGQHPAQTLGQDAAPIGEGSATPLPAATSPVATPQLDENPNPRWRRTAWIALLLVATTVAVVLFTKGVPWNQAVAPPRYPVAIDASPFARVQVLDSEGRVAAEDQTPFSTLLSSGDYRVHFSHGSESRVQEIKVPLPEGRVVRESFLNEGETRTLLEHYLRGDK